MLTTVANFSRTSKRGETRVGSIKRYQQGLLIEHKIARNGGRTRPEQIWTFPLVVLKNAGQGADESG